MEQRRQ